MPVTTRYRTATTAGGWFLRLLAWPAWTVDADQPAYVFAGASAGLVAALILTDPTLLRAFQAAGSGAAYGLFTGWIIGAAILGTWRGAR